MYTSPKNQVEFIQRASAAIIEVSKVIDRIISFSVEPEKIQFTTFTDCGNTQTLTFFSLEKFERYAELVKELNKRSSFTGINYQITLSRPYLATCKACIS